MNTYNIHFPTLNYLPVRRNGRLIRSILAAKIAVFGIKLALWCALMGVIVLLSFVDALVAHTASK